MTDNFSPIIASYILPLVKKQLKSLVNEEETFSQTIAAPPPSPVPPHTNQTSIQEHKTSEEGSTESQPTSSPRKLARLTPYDDSGDPTEKVVECNAGTIIGRRHFDRNNEVLSTISRKWFIVKDKESSCILCKHADSCPIWYTKGNSSIRVALKSEILLDEATIYIYHDRNDTALCHIDII